MKCTSQDDLIPAIHDCMRFKEEAERILSLIKTYYRIPK